jgi:UDP-glucose 6-dehydrogenase
VFVEFPKDSKSIESQSQNDNEEEKTTKTSKTTKEVNEDESSLFVNEILSPIE